MASPLDQRPVVVALAGPNGAGKTTFYYTHLQSVGLRFLNADLLARELNLGPYESANLANSLRLEMVHQRESFVFETVLSDPVGYKVSFLKQAGRAGYTVLLCFIGISGPKMSEQRVAMRVSKGGHDVPGEKLESRYSRTLANLELAIRELPHVWIFDNSNLRKPFRLIGKFEQGKATELHSRAPKWLRLILPQ